MHWREAEKNVGTNYKNNKLEKNTQTFFPVFKVMFDTTFVSLLRQSFSTPIMCTDVRTDGRTDIHVYHTYATVFLEKWQQSEVKFHERGTCILIKICCLTATSVAKQLIIQKKKKNRMFVSKCWHQETKCVIFSVTNLALNSVPMFLAND